MSQAVIAADLPWYRQLDRAQWNTLLASNLGWMFDGYEAFALVMAVGAALRQLLDPSQYAQIPFYAGTIIALNLLGWGIGGLVGGVLTDYLGRKRTMMLAIIAYSVMTGLSAFAWNWVSFAVLRFLVGLAIGSEWVTGTSIVAEIWPDKVRGRGVGLMQSGLGVGFFLASFAWLFIGAMGPNAWRYMFLLGVLPALMTIWIRRAIPESERWERVNDQRQAALARKRSGATLGAQDAALARFTVAGLFAEADIRNRVLLGAGDVVCHHDCLLGHRRLDPSLHGVGRRQGRAQRPGMGKLWRHGAQWHRRHRLCGVRLPGRRLRPQTGDDLLCGGRVPERAAAVLLGADTCHDADLRRPVRRLRVGPIHLDGGMAAGTVSDPHAGDGRGLYLQHPAPGGMARAVALGLADDAGRGPEPSRHDDRVGVSRKPGRGAVPAGDPGQTAAGVTNAVV